MLVLLFVSASALWGGAVLVVNAHGNPWGIMPLSLLVHSPFHSWLIPGMILFVANGLLALFVLLLTLRRGPRYGLWSALQGFMLLGWLVVECAYLRTVIWPHYFYGWVRMRGRSELFACALPCILPILAAFNFRRAIVSGILAPCWRKSSMHKLLCASLIVLFTAAAVAHSAGRKSTAEANKAVVKRAFAAFNGGDLKTLNELFDPDGPWHLPNGKTIPQGGPFTELAKSCPTCAALEQRKIVIDVIVAESDLVSVRSTWSGLYTGTTHGVSFHQKPLTLVYFNIYRVSGGRIRENWAEYDRMSMAEQLGFQVTPPLNPQ